MNKRELFRIAAASLQRNRRRSLLSMLGIVIGIAAVVMILSISAGFQRNLNQTLTRSGNGKQTGIVYFTAKGDQETQQVFTEADISLAKTTPGVTKVRLVDGEDNTHAPKIDMGQGKVQSSWIVKPVVSYQKRIEAGRGITAADNDLHHRYVVVSRSFADAWAKRHNRVIGSYLNLNGYNYEIVGIFATDHSVNLFTGTTDIYVPKTAYATGKAANAGDGLQITISNQANSKKVLRKVQHQLKERGSAKARGSYHIQDNQQAMAAIGKVLKGITTFIGAVAGISLLIAGIGVMNMTYISVAERMPEIGIRRALGATPKDITNQFLIEGTLLTSVGGLVGYLIGSLLAVVAGHFLPFPVRFDGKAFWLAFLVSTAIGLVFSVGPARSATKKNLLELLR